MRSSRLLPFAISAALTGIYAACAAGGQATTSSSSSSGPGGMGGASSASSSASTTSSGEGGTILMLDGGSDGPNVEEDAACAAVVEEAVATPLPVDIIWMVDNSASMASSIVEVQAGLNAFAALIAASSLDYKVIMLALRGKNPVVLSGSTRYPVCIPPPLSGDNNCANGPLFFQSSVDIRSTQPLEQFLGTLAQTDGYKVGQPRGGDPWAAELRPNATKTIVVVTDDNARLSVTDFETFAGGQNPFNSLTLPPGILDPSWGGIFNDYLFDGIYGWGSDVDPSVKCTFMDNTQPASSGPTYTTLVNKTGGVRAKICDGSAAWAAFFDAVAQAVIATSKLSCELDIPTPSMGTLDPLKVNVAIGDGGPPTYLVNVGSAAGCGMDAGWYYDDPQNPTKVILCPAACDQANMLVGPGKTGQIQVLFGCQTIVK